MDLKQLESFVRVAEMGSFSRAATALDVPQPSLSRHVRQLEQEMRSHLFVRTGRGVELTEAGQCLLSYGHAMLELSRQAHAEMDALRGQLTGRVTVGLPPRVAHVLTADLVEQFRMEFADCTISVVEALSLRLREWLVAGKLDMAILFDPPHSPLFVEETLARERIVLIGPRPLPARMKLAELGPLPLVMPSGPNALRQLLEQETRPRGVPLNIVAEVDSVQTVLSLVARGVCHTILPESALRLWNYPHTLHRALLHSPAMRNRVVLAIPKARPATWPSRHAAGLLRTLAQRHYAS